METVINPAGKYLAITGVIMSDEAYTSRPGSTLSLCFPRLPLVCSFLPSSITLETLLLLVGKISGLKPDHQGQRESLSRSRRKRTSFVFSPYSDFSNTEESWPYGNSRTPKCPCTAITNVPSLLSDVPVWKALTFISREACPGAFFVMRVSSISSILSSQNQDSTSPHAQAELLALPLVCHLLNIATGNHLMHKGFIEHSGKTFSCDRMWRTCISVADMINTSSGCSHPCPLMGHLLFALQSVGYFLLAEVELDNKDFQHH